MDTQRERALKSLSELFGDRQRQHEGPEGIVATVLPVNVDEVRHLSQIAARHALSLVSVGAGTASGEDRGRSGDSILVRFDLMGGIRVSEDAEGWVEAEAGATWLSLDGELRRRGRGLAVYPTSAPRATVGGWLATDGIGVGSFEYGRLRENVLLASVVMRGGELRKVEGGEGLGYFFGAQGGATGVVVEARIRSRRADHDRVFAAAFEDARALCGAMEDFVASDAPLWHLAFVSPAMAAARGLRARLLLFGVLPVERDGQEWWILRSRLLKARGGTELDPLEARRIWGERFFPVTPRHPTPSVSREIVPVSHLAQMLRKARSGNALQGTVSRSGEALILTLTGG